MSNALIVYPRRFFEKNKVPFADLLDLLDEYPYACLLPRTTRKGDSYTVVEMLDEERAIKALAAAEADCAVNVGGTQKPPPLFFHLSGDEPPAGLF